MKIVWCAQLCLLNNKHLLQVSPLERLEQVTASQRALTLRQEKYTTRLPEFTFVSCSCQRSSYSEYTPKIRARIAVDSESKDSAN